MVNNNDFAKRLGKVIDFYGISASAFADSISVQRSSISHILSGRNKPSLDFVMKILDKYPEVELHWLINGKGNFPKDDDVITKSIPSTPSLFENKNDKHKTKKDSIIEEKTIVELKNSSISRIVIFYKDGTFDEFKND